MVYPKDREWEIFLEGLNGFTDDFLAEGRPDQGEFTPREPL